VPALCDLEVVSVMRRLARQKLAPRERISEVVADYLALPLTRHGHTFLVPRVLELIDRFTAYDAAYIALAEALELPFATADERLARAIRGAPGVSVRLAG
jgi:predicted nucleic acid-binding protein